MTPKNIKRFIGHVVSFVFIVSVCCGQKTGSVINSGDTVPVIYSTDLFHPYGDADDQFDLAAMYAIDEIRLKAIILDTGEHQKERHGTVPVSQMNKITGRNVPCVIGLTEKLNSPSDKALDQDKEFQKGVETILTILKESPIPVSIVTVGTLRDVAAAFNREPELFYEKVSKLMIFIGEASSTDWSAYTKPPLEHNAWVDENAYICIMRSGLRIYWIPCFDGGIRMNFGSASYWETRYEELLKYASQEVIQYFVYALAREKSDPLKFLTLPVDTVKKERFLKGPRRLFCTSIFTALSDRKIVTDGLEYFSIPKNCRTDLQEHKLFEFREVYVSIDDNCVITYGRKEGSKKIMRFEVADKGNYVRGMTSVTAHLLGSLKTAGE